jgi:hypothetical protein
MPVNTQCKEYQQRLPEWNIVRDCVEGELAIKAESTKYLPRPSGMTEAEYQAYLLRARFFDGTSRTAEGYHGHIFAKDPVQSGDVSDAFKEYLDDVDASGTNLDQFASNIVWDTMQAPWGGILVDHTPVEPGTTEAGDKGRAYLKSYPAETVINWKYSVIGGTKQLSKVVLREDIVEENPNDEFETITTEAYRVLSFNENGKYIQRVFIKDENAPSGFSIRQLIDNIKINGNMLDFIPFFTCPGEKPEKSMLLGLAFENIGFYQRTADLENGLHLIGIPTPVAENMDTPCDEEEVTKDGETKIIKTPKVIRLGGTDFLFFIQRDVDEKISPNVHVKFLEFSGAGLQQIAQANNDGLVRMAKLGIQAIGPEKKGVETAEVAQIHRAAEFGVLGAFARNMSYKLTPAVRLMMIWNGFPEDEANAWSVELNNKFDYAALSAQIIQVMYAARQANEIPRKVWYNVLKQSGKLDEEMTFEAFVEEISGDQTSGHGPDRDTEGERGKLRGGYDNDT